MEVSHRPNFDLIREERGGKKKRGEGVIIRFERHRTRVQRNILVAVDWREEKEQTGSIGVRRTWGGDQTSRLYQQWLGNGKPIDDQYGGSGNDVVNDHPPTSEDRFQVRDIQKKRHASHSQCKAPKITQDEKMKERGKTRRVKNRVIVTCGRKARYAESKGL